MIAEDLLKKLPEQVPGMVYQYQEHPDGRRRFPFASTHIWSIYEVRPEDVVGDATKVFDRIHPHDLHAVAESIRISRENLTPWDEEYRVILPSKGELWLHGRAKPERMPDGSVIWHGYIQDITDRKKEQLELERAKEQFELAIRGSKDGIWDWDIASNIVFFSDRWLEQIGYSRSEFPASYERFIEQVHPDDIQMVLTAIQDYLAHRTKHYNVEFRFRHKHGHYIWILARAEAFQDANGLAYRMAGSHTDITQQKKTEEELIAARRKAEAASRSKSEFLANMSHEIRTPLNGVIGFSELLSSTEMSREQKQYVDNIITSANSLMGLINDILDFSKIEAGKLDLEECRVDLIRLLEETSTILQYNAAQKNLDFILEMDPNLPQYLTVDPIRLKQILINLLGNAIKFTETGEIGLKVTVDYPSESTNEAIFHFSVHDTGIGISPENQCKIFQKFTQADASITRKYGGTGLGLVISNSLVHQMGGNISIVSELGKGSVFSFSIRRPCEQGEDLNHSPYGKKLDSITSVLAVGTNTKNLSILQGILEKWEVSTIIALGIEDAVAKLRAHKDKVNAIALDLYFPKEQGIGVIRTLRTVSQETQSHSPHIPIVLFHRPTDLPFLTAEGKEWAVDYHITKPAKPTDIYKVLTQMENSNITLFHRRHQNIDNSIEQYQPRILIAEDVPLNMDLARRMVTRIYPSAIILEAIDGSQAVEICKEQKVDLILMDVQMPIMDGYTATQNIRKLETQNGKTTPIIALTAGVGMGEKEKCMAAGMDEFLTKPMHKEDLRVCLEKYLPSPRLSR